MIYIGKVFNHVSILEIIFYSLLASVILGLCLKWFIYDPFIKPKRKKKDKKTKQKYENEEEN